MTNPDLAGPDPDAITEYITSTYPETDVFTIIGATFYSFDPESHWPAFATIVTADDDPKKVSNLARPGVYRLNIGVSRETFDRLVGSDADPDYAAIDRLLPHPDYAKQHWVAILNPSASTYAEVVVPLLEEAHDRLMAVQARHRR